MVNKRIHEMHPAELLRRVPFYVNNNFLTACVFLNNTKVFAVFFNYIAVPVSAVFYNSFLCYKINKHNSETLAVAESPFKIIHKRPLEISAYIRALLRCLTQRKNISVQKIDSVRIMHLSVKRYRIMTGHSVFGYVYRQLIAFVKEFCRPFNSSRRNGPAVCRARKTLVAAYLFIPVLSCLKLTSVINILTIEIKRLTYGFSILLPCIRQIFSEVCKSVLRIFTENHRIAPP